MKILFIAPRFPHPPIQGDRLRAYELLSRLRERHAITLVTAEAPQGEAARVAPAICERHVALPPRRVEQLAQVGRALAGPLPIQTVLLCPPSLGRRARELLAEEPFDLVHAHTARVAPATEGAGRPVVIDFIDALSLNMRRRAAREPGPARWLFALEARRMARYEQQLARTTARQIVSSPRDREAIGASARLHVIANGVALDQFPYQEEGRDARTIVFSGRMGYFPNADAAQFFAREALPLVRRRVPDARLLIVGADPPRRVRALARLPGVEVTGYVPSVAEILRGAAVAVAPLRAGSGSQLKALEAMASGAPLVATPFVLEGLEAQAGEHLLAAEEPAALAEHVVRLLLDPALRLRLARSARALIEERYTWEGAAAALERVWEEARA